MNQTLPLEIYLPLKIKFSLKSASIFSLFLIFSLLFFFLFQVNSLTFLSHQIKKSQEKIEKLSAENENLKIQLTKSNSLDSLENLILSQNFEKIDKIDYIQILDSQMVKQ
jgi:cell division protein FtsB